MLAQIASLVLPGKTGVQIFARVLGRLPGAAWIPIVPANISAITLQTTDLTLEDITVGSGAIATHVLTVANVVLTPLVQNDPAWADPLTGIPIDSQAAPGKDGYFGYNFLTVVPAADFANSGDQFQVTVAFVPVAGEPFRIIYPIATLPVYA